MTSADCSFCRIAVRLEKARVVYETSDCLAFLPLRPATPGHTLVIPKVHAENVYEIVPELAASVMVLGVRLARAIRTAFGPDGVNLINSTGGAATQTVPHFHLHVVPRWPDDAMVINWPDSSWEDARLDEMAGCLSSVIADR